ncbi:TPA: ArsR family transcriptional regulator [Candidatus Bathyarchaeota archaeon]|nr:ArsR family transcriptional regulator [Candidatus Bathyarchaeota archaeon]
MFSLREEALAEYRILDVRMPPTVDYQQDIEWICRSFGFLEPRDKKKTAARIFRLLLEAAKEDKGYTSNELAKKIGLTRGTVVHHLNLMIKRGLVIYHENQYKLRGRSLRSTIREIERDIGRVFENLDKVAATIDETLGLHDREIAH